MKHIICWYDKVDLIVASHNVIDWSHMNDNVFGGLNLFAVCAPSDTLDNSCTTDPFILERQVDCRV